MPLRVVQCPSDSQTLLYLFYFIFYLLSFSLFHFFFSLFSLLYLFTEYPPRALHASCWIWGTNTYQNSHPTARAARLGGLGMQGGKAWVRRAYSVALNGLWNGVVSVLWNWLLALSRF